MKLVAKANKHCVCCHVLVLNTAFLLTCQELNVGLYMYKSLLLICKKWTGFLRFNLFNLSWLNKVRPVMSACQKRLKKSVCLFSASLCVWNTSDFNEGTFLKINSDILKTLNKNISNNNLSLYIHVFKYFNNFYEELSVYLRYTRIYMHLTRKL